MKIDVKNLDPNPFREMDSYPLVEEKLEALRNSIKETKFWRNIVARPNPETEGRFQIAYGHHRLAVLQELKIKTVNIPVMNLDDPTMLKIMATENLDTWGTLPKVTNKSVLRAKTYLDGELGKAKSFKTLNETIKRLVDKHNFDKLKKEGVGQTTVLKFLGSAWKQWVIQEALATIRDVEEGRIDQEAVEQLPASKSRVFREAVKRQKIPKKWHRMFAYRLVKEEVPKRNISEAIEELAEAFKIKPKPIRIPKPIPDIEEKMRDWTKTFEKLVPELVEASKFLPDDLPDAVPQLEWKLFLKWMGRLRLILTKFPSKSSLTKQEVLLKVTPIRLGEYFEDRTARSKRRKS